MKIVAVSENERLDLKKVRLASLKEAPAAFAIRYGDAIEFSDNEWKQRASGKNGPKFFIAYVFGEAVGLIGGVFTNDEFELISMWVAPDHRGTGVGEGLVQVLQNYARGEGHTAIVLMVSPSNKRACGLYQKCDFEVFGEGGLLASNESIELQRMEWLA